MLPVQEVVDRILKGEVVVLPTDTTYGLSCLAGDEEAIQKISRFKINRESKFYITLIGEVSQLAILKVVPTKAESSLMARYWPGPLTIVFSTGRSVRLPDYPELREVIRQTGPIVSTSANPCGRPIADSIEMAREYFGDKVTGYFDAGRLVGSPSTVVQFQDDILKILRQGELRVV